MPTKLATSPSYLLISAKMLQSIQKTSIWPLLVRQACETIVGKASWSYATGCSASYFSKGTLNSMVMSVAHIDDQNLFEMALPIAVLSGENSHAKEAIVIMRQRYGDA
jgi:hypothetical protein